jgi:predicted aspartyl protease
MSLDKKCWDYKENTPFVPVKLIGKEIVIEEWALVDTGASCCVFHPKFMPLLGLKKIKIKKLNGFGSKEPIVADIAITNIEVNGFKEKVEVACIREKYYPLKVPKVIIGRNFLNKYQITLNGREICIGGKKR